MNKTFSTFIILGLLSGCGSGSSSPTAALQSPPTGDRAVLGQPLHPAPTLGANLAPTPGTNLAPTPGPISPLHRGQSYPHNGELIPPPTTFHHPGPPPSLI